MAKVYSWVEKLSKFWGVHSSAFNILPSPKGLVAGPISIQMKSNSIFREGNTMSDDSQTIENDSQSTRISTQTTDGDLQILNGYNPTPVEDDLNMSNSDPNQQKASDSTPSTLNETRSTAITGTSKQRLIYNPSLIEDISIIEKITFTQPVPWVLIIEKDTVFSECVQKLNRALQNESDNGGKGYGIVITVRRMRGYYKSVHGQVKLIYCFIFSFREKALLILQQGGSSIICVGFCLLSELVIKTIFFRILG